MFSSKIVTAKVSNPQLFEEKVLFMSNKYLLFDL